ncbi:MAG TPA: protein kinase [Vicinamibacterales bacterium]|nr:protein kinase [Vicinamibacterales bacterium]
MGLTKGQRLAQYEILSPLGSGGMGEVYRARDLRLDREVAIKVMAEHVAADPEMRRRFETEARAVAALSHPGILSIYELVNIEGIPVAVMELLEGETLRQRLRRGPLEWREAVRIATSVAEGLAAAHAKGVVHRDLKPDNVFLTAAGLVKILDFGLALQRLDPAVATIAQTAQGVILGTFGYMSPEQVLGERVDGRSDIFAAGCVLYEMLTGRPLFTGATPQEIIAGVIHDRTGEIGEFDPGAPAELRTIVVRAIARDPARRFQSAQDLGMALRSLLTGSGSSGVTRTPRRRGKSLAVLPFVNAGADPTLEHVADGITESIINSLSQLSGIRVVPRSLAFRYKGLQADPATVGLALNARTILTGRVTQYGDILNIQAELVDTRTESQLWGEQFRQSVRDLLTVQEEIAWQISEALRLKLTGEQKKKLRKRATVNPDAYQEYLRGRYHWNNFSPDSLRRAREHFERAVALDPGYALAYAGLGDTFGAMSYYGHILPSEGFPRAAAAARRALELDAEVADAHVTLGIERLFWGWDWAAAERELQTAIRLNPNLALAHSVYGLILAVGGRNEEALKEARHARELDPLSLFINVGVAWVHHFGGRPADAMRTALKAREIFPGFEEAGNVLTSSYEALGRYEEAAAIIAQQPCWGFRLDAADLLNAFRQGGPKGYWRKRLELMEAESDTAPPGIHFARAIVHCQLGETEEALHHVERMVDEHIGACVFLGVDPNLAPLREHPRYQAALRRIGVGPQRAASAAHTAST